MFAYILRAGSLPERMLALSRAVIIVLCASLINKLTLVADKGLDLIPGRRMLSIQILVISITVARRAVVHTYGRIVRHFVMKTLDHRRGW